MSVQERAPRVAIRRRGAAPYSAAFLDLVLSGGGAWCREARAVVALAAQACLALDERSLILCDVRELQALRRRLAAEAVA
jgi:hypothetical protein